MIHQKLLIWVTSDCNLSCPLCNQSHSIELNPGYQMSIAEVKKIVSSCKRRGIHFSVIELIGGEPSMWKNIKEGIKLLNEITDDIFFVTNGSNSELVIGLGLKHWILSTSQATKKQLLEYKDHFPKMGFNSHSHKRVPLTPVPDTIPAECVVGISPFNSNIKENGVAYLRGKVYYCNLAFAASNLVPVTDDMVCDFEDDFITKFADKKFDKEICQYCLCNSKVWNKLPVE
jgi:organic radical activating enzyme